ncbi:hypothetical protein, partial [Xanthomonas graminis]|uniref:hypothetical protein n=2 Tax=Xanthomonas graminis TaxID=3390026 RepID=UPI001BB00A7A
AAAVARVGWQPMPARSAIGLASTRARGCMVVLPGDARGIERVLGAQRAIVSIQCRLRIQGALRRVEALSAACLRRSSRHDTVSSQSDGPMDTVSMIV